MAAGGSDHRRDRRVIAGMAENTGGQAMIGEGPQILQFPDREIPFAELPFAYRLMRMLDKNGAVVGFSEGPFRAGSCDVDENHVVQMWTQLHVLEDQPEALGGTILARFGKLITFGGLVIPHGLDCVMWQRARGVFVRHVLSYSIGTDALTQRWDVIVRKTHG